ncbi:hypothetical protein [Brevundimonas sp.]|uniref:hypothetical protein n=1 Tax=Brevundimonas sp. TaxID=1871086 RepID=UPI0026201E24|nr:hypothetical protein [Brevundimonas sp.]
MIKSSILAGVAVAVMLCASSAMAQMPPPLPAEALVDRADPAKVEWLRANVVADGPVTGGLSFDFPAEFYQQKLILLGESHGVAAPQVLDLELLTLLNARAGLTDYLAEVDPVQGAMLNQYLETGDEAVLDRVFDYWSGSGAQWGNTAFEAKVRGIRALNLTLPAERRVRILGIDAIQDWPLFAQWIQEKGGTADAEMLVAAAADRANPEPLADMALAAVASLTTQTPETARLSGVLGDLRAKAGREATIFNTYSRAVTSGELGDRPAYGLWGLFHIMQSGVNGARSFAARVKASDLPAARAMSSIIVLSLESWVQIPAPTPQGVQRMRLNMLNIDGPYVMVQGAATLKAASEPGQITLFNPRAAGSPLAGGDFMNIQSSVQRFALDEPNAPIDSYVQYVGVFRGSDWAAPRE